MTNINQSKLKKATKVFNEVFNKYDFMNDIMSLGTHRLWKKRMIEWMNPKKEDYLVDIASGRAGGRAARATSRRILHFDACWDANPAKKAHLTPKSVQYIP